MYQQLSWTSPPGLWGFAVLPPLRHQSIRERPCPLKNRHRRFLLILVGCLTFFAFLLSSFSRAEAVSVAPNKAVLTGAVREYSVSSSSLYGMSPEQTIYRLTIMVEASEDRADYLNFLKGKEGQILTFFTKADPTIEVYGKRIRAHVFYSGDERGGNFWIHKNIEIIK